MADSITARTMFFDNRNGEIRFHDWNVVNTSLGQMQEPRQLIGFTNGNKDNKSTQFNPSDQCAKVTNLVAIDMRGIEILLSDKKNKTIGGKQMPESQAY